MVRRIAQVMNGYSSLIGKVLYTLLLSGIILWTFCIVRDLPRLLAEYVTRAELQQAVGVMKADTDRQLDRMYKKVDSIDEFLRGNQRFVHSKESRNVEVKPDQNLGSYQEGGSGS